MRTRPTPATATGSPSTLVTVRDVHRHITDPRIDIYALVYNLHDYQTREKATRATRERLLALIGDRMFPTIRDVFNPVAGYGSPDDPSHTTHTLETMVRRLRDGEQECPGMSFNDFICWHAFYWRHAPRAGDTSTRAIFVARVEDTSTLVVKIASQHRLWRDTVGGPSGWLWRAAGYRRVEAAAIVSNGTGAVPSNTELRALATLRGHTFPPADWPAIGHP